MQRLHAAFETLGDGASRTKHYSPEWHTAHTRTPIAGVALPTFIARRLDAVGRPAAPHMSPTNDSGVYQVQMYFYKSANVRCEGWTDSCMQ
jgi:hypothetical protein